MDTFIFNPVAGSNPQTIQQLVVLLDQKFAIANRLLMPLFPGNISKSVNGTNGTTNPTITLPSGGGGGGPIDIPDNSITTIKLVDSTVTAAKLAANSVTVTKIIDGAISELKIAANAVTEAKIAANAISTIKIQDLAITGSKFGDNVITTLKLVDDAVTEVKIATAAVTTTKISDNAITTPKLVANAVTANKIAANTITAAEIAAGTITGDRLFANTVTASQIAANTITSNELASNSVTAAKIVAASITSAQIAAATILGGNIAASTITGGNIAALTITASNIQARTITANEIVVGTITALEIASDTITTNKLNAVSMNAIQLTLSSAGHIKGGQTGYDAGTGFFLGYSSGYKFSIGNSSGNKLTWNGSVLTLVGSVTATSGTIGGFTISATSLSAGSGTSYVALDSGLIPFFQIGDSSGVVYNKITRQDVKIIDALGNTLALFSGGTGAGAISLRNSSTGYVEIGAGTGINTNANITAAGFSGSGAFLNSLNGSNITSGTINAAYLPTVFGTLTITSSLNVSGSSVPFDMTNGTVTFRSIINGGTQRANWGTITNHSVEIFTASISRWLFSNDGNLKATGPYGIHNLSGSGWTIPLNNGSGTIEFTFSGPNIYGRINGGGAVLLG